MTAPALVTIVIPVYNGADYLATSINCALSQTWPAIEVLVIDDGSIDGGATEQVARSFGDRIRYVQKPNGGVGTALNTGIHEMRGEYFSWLSHDDLYDPRKVEIQMRALAQSAPLSVGFCDYDCVNSDCSFISRTLVGDRFDSSKPLWAVLEGLINGCTLLIPKACLEAVGDFETGLFHSQDYEYWFRLFRRFPLVHTPGALVRYRVHATQSSHSHRHIDEASLLWMDMLERLTDAEMIAYEGSPLAFLVRAGDFIKRTGYVGAKLGVPKLVERAARDQPLGVVLHVSTAVYPAISNLKASGLTLRFQLVDGAPTPLESFALTSPELVAQHGHLSGMLSMEEIARAAVDRLSTDLIAFIDGNDPATSNKLRAAYEKLSRSPELDGLVGAASVDESGAFGHLGGAVIRRSALQGALARTVPGRRSSFESAIGISARLAAA